jgi:hypothetical protein
VSPFVSPEHVKMRRFVITREEHNNFYIAIGALLMRSANWCKNALLPLGNPCSVR